MDIQIFFIIMASVAISLALESIILMWWLYRKTKHQLVSMRQDMKEVKATMPPQKDDQLLRQLVDKLAPAPDFPEDILDEPRKQETPAETEKGTPSETLLKQAYEVFYTRYQEQVADMSIENMEEKKGRLATLLFEMGYWLKDFLPVWHEDFSATEIQKANVRSISLAEQQWQDEQAKAPLPTTNPYKTPLEVIALVQHMQQWGIQNFRLLISGYRYQQKNTES